MFMTFVIHFDLPYESCVFHILVQKFVGLLTATACMIVVIIKRLTFHVRSLGKTGAGLNVFFSSEIEIFSFKFFLSETNTLFYFSPSRLLFSYLMN